MSSKYNEHVIEAACEAIDWAEELVVTDAIALAVFDTLERAPWWEEVTDGNTVVPAGCPVRREAAAGDATERTYASTFTAWQWLGKARVFIDTRWTPPPAPLAVGDVIETVEQAESLPVGTIAVTKGNTAYRKVGAGKWQRIGGVTGTFADRFMAGYGDRIIYLPSGDSE